MTDKQINILLIEDDPGDADLLQKILSATKAHQFSLEVSTDLHNSLERLALGQIDVVLLDLSLPDSQGLDTFTQVYAQAPDIPIVVLSGLDDETIAVKAVQIGAQDYLVKDKVDNHLLVRSLRYAIERKRTEKEIVRLYKAERARYRETEALRQAALTLAATTDLNQVLEYILVQLQKVVPYDSASVMLLIEDKLNIVAQHGLRLGRKAFIPMQLDTLPHVQEMLKQNQPIIIPNTALDSRWQRLTTAEAARCWLGVPLLVQDQIIGLLNLNKKEVDTYTKRDAELALAFASHGAIAIKNAQLFEQVRAGRERLQNLSAQLVEVQESERRHIARELHDEIGQVLTGLKLLLEMSMASSAQLTESRLKQALTLVDELTARVQEMSLNLRPSMLDDLGVVPTLAWHFQRYSAQTDIEVIFKYIGSERRFPPNIETAIYRITQEALTNVARYAKVKEVIVTLWAEQNNLRLQVVDQGVGFNVKSALSTNASNGLTGMIERAALLGGQLTIESTKGVGTSLIIDFPLESGAS